MLDIKKLRTNFDATKAALAKRGGEYHLEEFLEVDKQRLETLSKFEQFKARQNAVSRQIPALKKSGADVSQIMTEMKTISDEIKLIESELRQLEERAEDYLMRVPNTPHELVPVGASDADNIELRKWGAPPEFAHEQAPKPHWELGEALDIIDPATAAKTTGARFTFYKGAGARLERALINFMLNTHIERGYVEIMPPYIVHTRSLLGTGQLPKFEEDQFKIADTDFYLNPTAEVPITNMYREEILPAEKLPIYHTAHAPSFRAEAGSAGRDTRGLIRQHQFNKVELVKLVRPEDSYAELDKLTADAENILQLLKLPYRVVRLCTGDLGFCAAMTYDIEVWMPSYNRYVEISSCSNFEDFQARRAHIRYRAEDGKPHFVHTLNGSGLAVGRTTAAILENYQQPDGTIKVPEVLQDFMGAEII